MYFFFFFFLTFFYYKNANFILLLLFIMIFYSKTGAEMTFDGVTNADDFFRWAEVRFFFHFYI
jgi:hypothetical protein